MLLLRALRESVVDLMSGAPGADDAAEVFVVICVGYTQQLAVRGDIDPAPFAAALLRTVSTR